MRGSGRESDGARRGLPVFPVPLAVFEEIPPDLPAETQKALMNQVMSDSRHIIESMGLRELQSGLAFERHTERLLGTINFLVHQFQAKRGHQ